MLKRDGHAGRSVAKGQINITGKSSYILGSVGMQNT